jgi:hypothetical protein
VSKVAIQGNASGTGTFTIAAPNSNTDRTLTLPDEAGTIATTNGITGTDQWRLHTSIDSTRNIEDSDVERTDDPVFGKIGSGMSVSSEVWTFPSTGLWLVSVNTRITAAASDTTVGVLTYASTNGGSSFDLYARATQGNGSSVAITGGGSSQVFVNVTDTSQIKVKFSANSIATGSSIQGGSDDNRTSFTFIRLGDST